MSRQFALAVAVGWIACTWLQAEDSPRESAPEAKSRAGLEEPLFRVSKARIDPKPAKSVAPGIAIRNAAEGEHPLDPAIHFAKDGLERIRTGINDYTCTLVKQERINGELLPPEYMYAEVRNRKVRDGRMVQPFSVYMYFLKPEKIKGREVIYVEGRNDGNLVAHEANFLKVIGVVQLRPDSDIAMRGNRYPITEVGLENLVAKLIEKAERDRRHGECNVQFKEGVKINGRGCTMLEVVHPVPRPHFDFHVARIYIDDELYLPVRYEAYTWPKKSGGQPELLECYTYLNLKVNLGLEDKQFEKERFRL